MPLTTFDRFLPWAGAVAGAAWIGQGTLGRFQSPDLPDGMSAEVINEHVPMNIGGLACLAVMAVAMIFFATAVRTLWRSGEAAEATYSSIAFGAWITVAAALGQTVAVDYGVLAAAEENNQPAVQTLGYLWYFGWAGMADGVAAGSIAMGSGGIRSAMLPQVVGATHRAPGRPRPARRRQHRTRGLVNYLLLPFWLIAPAIIGAKPEKTTSRSADTGAIAAPAKGV